MVSKVRAVRLERGLKQMEIVEKSAGILNQYRLSVIERGLKPRSDEAAALSAVLGVPVNELWPN